MQNAKLIKAVMLSLLLACSQARAQVVESYAFPANRIIPDGNAAGISDTRSLGSTITNITSVKVGLKIPGEFNGDLYGYIRHAGRLVVVLNRPGKTAAVVHGYADAGLQVSFQADAPAGDIHAYRGVTIPAVGLPLTGFWQQDGRAIDPQIVADDSSRSTSLTDFNGLDAAGDWTLYLADVESGGTNYLTQWSLEVSGASGRPASNSPPVFEMITNRVISPDSALAVILQAYDPDGDQLTFNLDSGPAGAYITNFVSLRPMLLTNTVLRWTPTRAMASTTSFFTVRVSDNGAPSLSVLQSFAVTVLDYLDLSLGATNVQAGDVASIPITLSSDRGVTGLTFSIPWRYDYLTNATLSVTAPGVASADLQHDSTNLVINLQSAAGQSLQGIQQIGQLSFQALSNGPSAFINLPITDVLGYKPGPATYSNNVLHAGSVAVVEDQALLLAGMSGDVERELTIFGRIGAGYQLQFSTNLVSPVAWYPLLNYTQTNGLMRLRTGQPDPTIFYRLLQTW